MRNRKTLGIAVLAAGLMLSGCTGGKQAQTAPELLEPVSVAENTICVERRDIYSANTINVTVVPEVQELYFTMDGVIEHIEVTEGQSVRKDQVLATIDQQNLLDTIKECQKELTYKETIYSYRLEQADLKIRIAEAGLAQLQEAYDQQEQKKAEAEAAARKAANQTTVIQPMQALPAEESGENTEEQESSGDIEGSLPEESSEPEESSNPGESSVNSQPEESRPVEVPVQSGITAYDLKQAQLSVQQAELEYGQLQDEYRQEIDQQEKELQSLMDKVGEDTILAPCDGRIVSIQASPGSSVRAYDTVMLIANEKVKMLQGDKFSNNALIAAKNMDVLIDGTAYAVTYIPYDEEEYLRANMNKESLPSRFTFDAPEDMEYGESGTIRIYKEYSPNALVVPAVCVQQDDMGTYVYKADDGQRIKTYVTVGIKTISYAEILEGLSEGDEVYGAE